MSKYKNQNPKCQQNRHNCFACNKMGRCQILTNTEFKHPSGKTKKCPFFKDRKDVIMYEPSKYHW